MKFNKQITHALTRGAQLSVALIVTTLLTTTVYAEALPGAFPKTSVFQGYYKDIKSTDLYFPTGNWHLMANGRIYSFKVQLEGAKKLKIISTLGNIEDIKWDRNTGEFTFTRVRDQGENQGENRILIQQFNGYLMTYADGKQKGSQRDDKWRMAGTFIHESKKHAGSKSGWYATLPR